MKTVHKDFDVRGPERIYFSLEKVDVFFFFMHLADAFIQSDLHCIQVTVFTFYQLLDYGQYFGQNE